ncbi:MAG TPA: hypothetical protein VE553_06760 [Candidatus Binatia bacterium]|jgi:predicted phosphodiesterase|nr:hypothetical protein [Candidatus Binatia bacterium]
MLVIISDLHLTDGTTGTTIGSGAFEDFQDRLKELAFDASWREDGRYEPVEALDLVLLGDVLDVVRSTRWSEAKTGARDLVRPWHDWNDPRFAAKIDEITSAILERNKESLAFLKAFSEGRAITVPADPQSPLGERVGVDVRIHYLAGNHDWYYHIPAPAFDAIREKIGAAIGLCHGSGPYVHDPMESAALIEIYRRHRLFARHGDIYDPFNYVEQEGRDVATLGDAMVVDLINRFPHEVRQRMGHLPAPFLDGLDELANVRPSVLVPVWVDGLLKSAELGREQTDRIKAIWDGLVDEFLEVPFVRKQDKPFWPDLVDGLQATLHLSKRLPFDDIARLVTLISKKGGTEGFSYARRALKEEAFESGMADHIVYGHTHHYEVVPLDQRQSGGRTINRMCFNSGTWHAIHERTLHSMVDYRFASFHVMTYLAFFAGDERKGRAFETWSGTLGVADSTA